MSTHQWAFERKYLSRESAHQDLNSTLSASLFSDGVQIKGSKHLVNSCKAMLQQLEKVNPQLGIDGKQNIWIIKPVAMSRGRGRMLTGHLKYYLKHYI